MSNASHPEGYVVAVLGATGLVGQTMISVLEERNFPVLTLVPLASTSGGRTVRFRGADVPVQQVQPESFSGVDIAIFSAGGAASLTYAPEAASRGCVVVDNSSAWRMDPKVPLVVSQVNPGALTTHDGIIANPNCSTMQLAPLLKALSDAAGLERVVVATYQAVSGAGAKAVVDLDQQRATVVSGGSATSTIPPLMYSSQTVQPKRRRRSSTRVERFSTCRSCASLQRQFGFQLNEATPRRCTSSYLGRSAQTRLVPPLLPCKG